VPYAPEGDVERYFLSVPPQELLPFETITSGLNRSFYRAVPGMLTGMGLTLTFCAILLGLWGVHYDHANTVEPIVGIDGLINGLSGKFLSSIVALVLSILFTLQEITTGKRLRGAYEALMRALSRSLPTLTAARLLLDIRKHSADASVEVAHISSDVVARFTSAFNDHVVPQLSATMANGVAGAFHRQISPTLDKMTGSLESLQGAIVGLEADKQESVTGEFEKLLRGLEQSMTMALEKMSGSFRDALAGSAREEFTNMQATLEGTRHMLAAMTGEFSSMQATFAGVVSRTEEATRQQVETARIQTDSIQRVMQDVLANIATGTRENLQVLQQQLGETITQLISQVNISTNSTQQSANKMLGYAESTTQAMASRLEQVLKDISARTDDFGHASARLMEAQTFISAILTQSGDNLKQLAAAGAEVRSYTADMKAQAASLATVVTGHTHTADRLAVAASHVEGALTQQAARLQHYEGHLEQFETLMVGIDKQIAAVLKEFADGFSDYQESVRRNFDGIVTIANSLVPKAVTSLEARVEEFSDQMTTFSDVIADQIKTLHRVPNGRAV
jgi:hypothetical protein